MRALLGIMVLGLTIFTARADEGRFARPVQVTGQGKETRIAFAATAPTDCAVAIVDAQGKVVRHLAAGLLGKNAPPPLKKDSLEQVLTWDGLDDYGQPAAGGPFQVKVGLGLRPKLDKIIGHDPYAITSVRGIATGPDGQVYVFHVSGNIHPNDGSLTVSVFDRAGKYLRTILPHPANLPADKTRGIRQIEVAKDVRVPFLYQGETRSFIPGAGDLPEQRPVVTRDGKVAFVGVQEGPMRYAQPGVAQVVVIGTDGSISDPALGSVLTRYSGNTAACLALSPDQKIVYASDVKTKGGKSSEGISTHAVYRFAWNDKEPKPFAGAVGQPGIDNAHLNVPRGIAVDADGNVYVADRGNNRIAVFKADGAFLASMPVKRPERVEVHPRTGAVYVLGGDLVNELTKFASYQKPEPVAHRKMPYFRHERYTMVMALDASAEPPLLWFGTRFSPYARFGVLRVEDKGTLLSDPVEITHLGKGMSVGPVKDLSVDRTRHRVYIGGSGGMTELIYDVKAGKLLPFPLKSDQAGGGVGLDGNFYALRHPTVITRYGPDLKVLPFAGQPDGKFVSPVNGSMRLRGRGVTADRLGNFYVLLQRGDENTPPGTARDANLLYLFGPDGKVKKEKLIDSEIRSLNSVRIDAAGNIYIALGLRPGKELLPPRLRGILPGDPKLPDTVGKINYYPLLYGSIAKFGPAGGVIKKNADGVECNYAFGTPVKVAGAEWITPGISPTPSWRTPGTPDICLCESPRFDVDGFGRSFYPDACLFRIGVLDTAGHEISTFGSYGNQDSAGPGSLVPRPDVPLHWPYAVAVGDEAIYVGDRLNCRVLRLAIRYDAESTQAIK